jgi:hypothetical protein
MPVSAGRRRLAELLLTLCVLIVGSGTILVGVQRYTDGEHARAEFELRSRLFLQRLEVCRTLADVTGHLVAYANEPGFPEALHNFRASSRGPLVLIADDALDRALADYDLSIGEFQARRIEARELKQRADLLIRTCRCAVERDTWKPADGRPVSFPGACRGVPVATATD